MKGDDIANRLLDLAIASLQLATRLEGTPAGKHIARQLIGCSTSTGANYEEARSAESPADFAHKVGIAAKEVGETRLVVEDHREGTTLTINGHCPLGARGQRARRHPDGFGAHRQEEEPCRD